MAVAGLAPDGLALARVGVDLIEEALGEHRAHHLGGGTSAQALGQRQGDAVLALSGGVEDDGLGIGMPAVQPTVELGKRNSRQRIDPLIDESPELRERVKPTRSRDAGNTMLSKEFAGGILIMTAANSAVGRHRVPRR